MGHGNRLKSKSHKYKKQIVLTEKLSLYHKFCEESRMSKDLENGEKSKTYAYSWGLKSMNFLSWIKREPKVSNSRAQIHPS